MPRKVIIEVEKVLKNFLWGGTRKVKVKQSNICQPNDKRGLGIPNLTILNDTYILRNIWNICELKEGLRVKWVLLVILKEKSFWEVRQVFRLLSLEKYAWD